MDINYTCCATSVSTWTSAFSNFYKRFPKCLEKVKALAFTDDTIILEFIFTDKAVNAHLNSVNTRNERVERYKGLVSEIKEYTKLHIL